MKHWNSSHLSPSDAQVLREVSEQFKKEANQGLTASSYSYWANHLDSCVQLEKHPLLDTYGPAWDSRELLAKLLQAGLDINVKNAEGFTPLLIAVDKKRSIPFIELLLEHGADVLASVSQFNQLKVKTSPKNAMQLAEKKKYTDLADFLRPLTEQALFQKNVPTSSNQKSTMKRL